MATAERLPLSEIVREAVASTSAHAISRVAPVNRDIKLRILWLLVFLCFLGLLLNSSIKYVSRLANPSVKSVLEAEKVDFEFPDVYFCNSMQAAGSFTCLLNATEVALVTQPLIAAWKLFNTLFASMNLTSEQNTTLRRLEAQSLIQSIPYKVLADIVGQRKLQTFYRNYGIFSVGSEPSLGSPVNIETLYHPNHLKCFKVALTDPELQKMRNTNNRLQFNPLLDPYFRIFEKLGLYSPLEIQIPYIRAVKGSSMVAIYPFDWNLENPLEIDRGSGMFLYLTPRGQYPSRITTSIVSLGPGRAYDIAIHMSDSQLTPSDFQNQCVDSHEAISFYNPYSGGADSFNYSEAFCHYTEMAKEAEQRYSCSPTPQPLPWQFRHLPLCLNLTAVDDTDSRERNMRAAVAAELRQQYDGSSSNFYDICSSKRLCLRRRYHVTSSFGMWPNEASLVRLVKNVLASSVTAVDPTEFRSLITGVKAMMYSADRGTVVLEEGASSYFRRAAIRVTLRTEARRSPLTTFSLDYNLSQFIANVGGALGLYLGCSLLTVIEIFELLHDLVLQGAFGMTCKMKSDHVTPIAN